MSVRVAVIENCDRQGFTKRIAEAYLPWNFEAVFVGDVAFVVGEDDHGWTLDGYVLPRLASGLYFGREVEPTTWMMEVIHEQQKIEEGAA